MLSTAVRQSKQKQIFRDKRSADGAGGVKSFPPPQNFKILIGISTYCIALRKVKRLGFMSSLEFAALDATNEELGAESNGESLVWKEAFISILLFILAGIFEIGGGYLIWKGVKERQHTAICIISGAIVLILYGFIPTLQKSDSFGRVYAVYGGFFIVMSYCWSVALEGFVPDIGDYIGGGVAIVGVLIAWFWPR